MIYGYMDGSEHPDVELTIAQGQYMAGHAIGILLMKMWQVLVPGNIANASTFHFPVRYEYLNDEDAGKKILRADPTLLEDIVAAGKSLQRQGVRAIVGGCGYFANYQKETAAALDIPVFLSSLLQVPLISRALKPGEKVGIICADARALTANTLRCCGIEDPSLVAVAGAEHLAEFGNILYETGHLNSKKLEKELIALAKRLIKENPTTKAILLECSDLPPYAASIQNAVGMPVFDFVSLVNWVHSGVVRMPFRGFL